MTITDKNSVGKSLRTTLGVALIRSGDGGDVVQVTVDSSMTMFFVTVSSGSSNIPQLFLNYLLVALHLSFETFFTRWAGELPLYVPSHSVSDPGIT